MNGACVLIGCRGDNRGGRDRSGWIDASIFGPKASHREGAFALAVDPVGCLRRFCVPRFDGGLPFEVPVRDDDTAVLVKEISEAGFFGQGFAASVDHRVRTAECIGPARDQSPSHGSHAGWISVEAGDEDPNALGWSDVIARGAKFGRLLEHCQSCARPVVSELRDQAAEPIQDGGFQSEAAAHVGCLPSMTETHLRLEFIPLFSLNGTGYLLRVRALTISSQRMPRQRLLGRTPH